MCQALGIHIIQSFFSSDYSNYIADKIGFETDSQDTMEEMYKIYPKVPFHQIEAKVFAIKTWDITKTE